MDIRIEHLDDPDDPRLHDYRDLTDVALRRVAEPAGGLYIAESAKVLARALAAGHRPRSVLVQEKWLGDASELLADADAADATDAAPVPVYVTSPEIAETVTGYAVHRGLLAAMHRPPLPSVAATVAGARLVLVLEDIVDHTNVGAIFRSCAALGADAVLVSPRCADPLYRRSIRVSMGTVFQVPWTRLDAWPSGGEALRLAGFETVALALSKDSVDLEQFLSRRADRLAVILGSEGDGLARSTLASVDRVVTIPMRGGVDSLNVAAAAAVAVWALSR